MPKSTSTSQADAFAGAIAEEDVGLLRSEWHMKSLCAMKRMHPTSISFVAEGDHGVHSHGAARGDVAGSEGDKREQQSDGYKSYWVVGANTVEEACKIAGHGERSQDAKGCSGG